MRNQKYSDEELVTFLIDKTKELGKTPTISEMCADKARPHATVFSRRFGSWNEALKKAGLEPKEYRKPKTYNDEEMIAALRDLASQLGRPPFIEDVRRRASGGMIPCPETYRTRFGSWDKVLEMAGLREKRQRRWWQKPLLWVGEWCIKKGNGDIR